MNDLLVRHGRENIPVFEGGIAPYSTYPHRVHIDEHVLDVNPRCQTLTSRSRRQIRQRSLVKPETSAN